MAYNDNKYGILNNMQHAWFFRRPDQQGNTLQYYGPISFEGVLNHSPSILKAFVGIILLAEIESNWFHAPLTNTGVTPGRYFGNSAKAILSRDAAVAGANSYKSTPVAGSYPILPLDLRLCHFKHTFVRHRRGCTARATLSRSASAGGNLDVFCKIADLCQNRDAANGLDTEVHNYAALQNLQGVVIPQVHGYYNVWGLLNLLALEEVGNPIPEGVPIDCQTRKKMKAALARIHSAGYVHGDVARRNFCQKNNQVFLVDLETLEVGSIAEMKAELVQVDEL